MKRKKYASGGSTRQMSNEEFLDSYEQSKPSGRMQQEAYYAVNPEPGLEDVRPEEMMTPGGASKGTGSTILQMARKKSSTGIPDSLAKSLDKLKKSTGDFRKYLEGYEDRQKQFRDKIEKRRSEWNRELSALGRPTGTPPKDEKSVKTALQQIKKEETQIPPSRSQAENDPYISPVERKPGLWRDEKAKKAADEATRKRIKERQIYNAGRTDPLSATSPKKVSTKPRSGPRPQSDEFGVNFGDDYRKGGEVKSSASKRADGCAIRGKTKGRIV